MPYSRLFWRILLVCVASIVLATCGLTYAVTSTYATFAEDQFLDGIDQMSLILADYGRQMLEDEIAPEQDDALYQLAQKSDCLIHIFDDESNLVATTVPTQPTTVVRLHPTANLTSNDEPIVQSQFESRGGVGQSLLVRRIEGSQGLLGYLQIEASRRSVERELQRRSNLAWLLAMIVCCVGVLFAFFMTARITRPLEELINASKAISFGNLYQTVPVTSLDEFGTLAKTFNTMSEELSSRINELQQQGAQLRENSARLATVLGGMVEGVIAVDSNEQILFANDAAFRMIEFEGKRVINRPYWEMVRNSDVQSVVRDVLSGQYQLKREVVFSRSQNRIAFIASRLPGEPCPGAVLVLHDVTELRRLEKVRSEFVSNVGHELKTPLAAIQACTETLSAGAIDDPKHGQYFLQQICDHSDRLHKLIIDLMELAKIESEDELFSHDVIDIGVPIQEAIDEHFSVTQSKKVELSFEATIEELLIEADPDGIRTIVNNLLDNAISYTPQGGRVQVKWAAEDGDVVIKVSDSGIGIEHKHLQRIFERFYRVDSARSREAGGTGLGLAIVKHLCQLFGGSIKVESEPESGSTFIVRFPLYHESLAEHSAT